MYSYIQEPFAIVKNNKVLLELGFSASECLSGYYSVKDITSVDGSVTFIPVDRWLPIKTVIDMLTISRVIIQRAILDLAVVRKNKNLEAEFANLYNFIIDSMHEYYSATIYSYASNIKSNCVGIRNTGGVSTLVTYQLSDEKIQDKKTIDIDNPTHFTEDYVKSCFPFFWFKLTESCIPLPECALVVGPNATTHRQEMLKTAMLLSDKIDDIRISCVKLGLCKHWSILSFKQFNCLHVIGPDNRTDIDEVVDEYIDIKKYFEFRNKIHIGEKP